MNLDYKYSVTSLVEKKVPKHHMQVIRQLCTQGSFREEEASHDAHLSAEVVLFQRCKAPRPLPERRAPTQPFHPPVCQRYLLTLMPRGRGGNSEHDAFEK